jgi:hypothetical protein
MHHSDVRLDRKYVINDPKYRGQVFEVEKINPRNIKLVSTDVTKRRVNCHPSFMSEAGAGTVVTEVALPTHFVVGEVVQFRPGQTPKGYNEEDLFVVIGDISPTRKRIAKLGGDSGRYWKVSGSHIERVTVPTTL